MTVRYFACHSITPVKIGASAPVFSVSNYSYVSFSVLSVMGGVISEKIGVFSQNTNPMTVIGTSPTASPLKVILKRANARMITGDIGCCNCSAAVLFRRKRDICF